MESNKKFSTSTLVDFEDYENIYLDLRHLADLLLYKGKLSSFSILLWRHGTVLENPNPKLKALFDLREKIGNESLFHQQSVMDILSS
jgi:hypothetical protein